MSATFTNITTATPIFFTSGSCSSSTLNSRSVLARSTAFYSERTLFMGAISLFCRRLSRSFSNYRRPIDISSCNGRTFRSSSGKNSVSLWEESAKIFFNRNSRSSKNDQNEVRDDRENEEHKEYSHTGVSDGHETESVRFRENFADKSMNKFIRNRASIRNEGEDVSDRGNRVRVSVEDGMKERSYHRSGPYGASRVSEEEIQSKVQEIEEDDNKGGRNHKSHWLINKSENSVKPGRSFKKLRGGIGEEDHRVPRSDKSHLFSRRSVCDKDDESEDDEDIDDPRWKSIRDRSRNVLEAREWGKQERWGKKISAETTMSSTKLRMTGEGVYGISPVLAALSAKRRDFYTLYTQKGMDLVGPLSNRKKKAAVRLQRILDLAGDAGVAVKEASKHDLNMAVDSRPHQGFILDASPLETVPVLQLDPVDRPTGRAGRDPGGHPVWVALDEVTDPQNLGAIIRSAFFFGAAGVVVCSKNSAPLSGVVSKASSGSLEVVKLRSCRNMMRFLTASSSNGWRVLGASVSPAATPLGRVSRAVPTVLVLGSEGSGLRVLVERSCTELVRIAGPGFPDPGSGTGSPPFSVESLNVSVAAGVFLHHLVSKEDQ